MTVDDSSTGRARTSRRGRVELVTWIVLVALAAAYFVWRVVDNSAPALHPIDTSYDATRARVGGSYVLADAGDDATRNASVRLPIGTVHVSVARPTTGVETKDDDDVTPPAGGSFVSLATTVDTSTATVPIDLFDESEQRIGIAVVAGGRRYPLSGRDDNVVAIAGRPASVSVEITFRGVTQRVDMASGKVSPGAAAAALYRPVPAGTQSCGTASLSKSYTATRATYPLSCTVSWRQVPFVPGRGWARPGSAWVLLSVTTNGPGAVLRSGRREEVYSSQGLLTVGCGDRSVADDLDRDPTFRNRDDVSLLTCPQTPGGRVAVSEELQTAGDTPLVADWTVRLH